MVGVTRTDSGTLGHAAPGAVEALARREMERATGSPTLEGNHVGLQFEGGNTFDAWLEAIDAAERFVYFENYVVRDDRVGRVFRDALVAKALEGVPVYVIHDWLGCWATPRRYWKPLRRAGVEVRAFNRPSVKDPFGLMQRDHRKIVVVDGVTAFVGGFCVGNEWTGTATDPPWRDTGVDLRGPAALAAAAAFERLWSRMGPPVPHPASSLITPEPAGGKPVWLIEGEPGLARVYRTLHLVAARVRQRLWITDAYFVAPRSISQALAAAARDGVDVRILVPANNNWPWVGSLSRGGYRFLLEHGVRVFEWQGPMMHAKTAVADGLWCRVGSSNMNAASLLGNWEIDVGVLDEELAGQMEGLFLADLASSVEIVLPGSMPRSPAPLRARGEAHTPRAPLEPQGSLPARLERELRALGERRRHFGMATLVRAGVRLGDALAGNRWLGREDRTVLGTVAVLVLAFAALAAIFPTAVGWTVAVIAAWLGGVTGIRAYLQARRAWAEESRARRAGSAGDGAHGVGDDRAKGSDS